MELKLRLRIKSMAIELNKQLMAFIDVVKFESFADAAKHRDMLPSLLSRNIKSLENKLGVVLLKRSTRALSLTEAGLEVYRQALAIKELESKLNNYTQGYSSSESGLVRITCPSHLSKGYILPVIQDIQQTYPDIMFEVDYADRQVDIIKEEFNLAIRIWKPQDSSLICQELRPSKAMLVASPRFIEKHGLPSTIEELKLLPFACYSRHGITRDKIHFYDEQNRVQVESMTPLYRSSIPESLVDSARAGMYYTFVLDHNVNDDLDNGSLIQLLPHIKLAEEPSIYAVYPHRELSFGARLFLEKFKLKCQQ